VRISRAGTVLCATLLLGVVPGAAHAQNLRYSNHREVEIPDYALLRIGPFYSSLAFSQTAGWRWSRSRGAGTDYLSDNRYGAIREDGTEFPLVSVLTMRNYLLLSRRADVDLSVSAMYAYFPRGTEDSGWQVFLPEEGISAGLSSEFRFTPFVKGTIFDNILYRTDFVDTRGLGDRYGGQKFEYFNNLAGVNMDWLMAKDQNMAVSFSREDMLPRDDEFADQERVSYTETAMYQYQFLSGLVLGAGASYVQHYYASTGRSDVALQNYFVNIGFALGRESGAQFRLTRATTGTLRLGYAVAAQASRAGSSGNSDEVVTPGDTTQGSLALEAKLETDVSKEFKQTISFSKGLRNGFASSVEEYEQWTYRLGWQRNETSSAIWTTLASADPEGGLSTRYSDWSSGVNLSAPIVRGVSMYASSVYSDRINLAETSEGLPLESTADYVTWTSTVGIRVPVTKSINFVADASHVERISGEDDLAYVRDVASATFTYTKQF
jgi:hypothetical protein